MRVYLKIKVKSLAAEAAIIRKEENKCRAGQAYAKAKDDTELHDSWREKRLGLASHRRFDVRQESRSAGLAYGFLKGRSYSSMEQFCFEGPDFKRIEQLVTKYGDDDPRERLQRFAAWLEAAKEHLRTAERPSLAKKAEAA